MHDLIFALDGITPFERYLQEIDLLLCDLPDQRRKDIKQELIAHMEDEHENSKSRQPIMRCKRKDIHDYL